MTSYKRVLGFRNRHLSRIVLICVGIPIITLVICLFPENGHWPLNALLIILSIFSTFEAVELFGMSPPKTVFGGVGVFVTALVFPTMAFLWVLELIEFKIFFPIVTFMAMVVISVQVFHLQQQTEKIFSGIGGYLAVLMYPGLLIAYLIMISRIPNSTILYIALFFSVTANDSAAYVAGQCFPNEGQKCLTELSPRKTAAGFLVGFAFSLLVMLIMYILYPKSFQGGLIATLGIGLLIGSMTIIGDLIESGLKRSVHKKNSAISVPEMGGVLDIIDSLLYTAPVFFYSYQILNDLWII